MVWKCDLCGTVEEATENLYSASIEYVGKDFGYISIEKKLCRNCAFRFFPIFNGLANDMSSICNDPFELVAENNKLKNEIAYLKDKIKNTNRRY